MWGLISRVLYPAILIGGVLSAWLVHQATDLPILLVGSGVVMSVGALVWILELLRPYQRSWRPPARCLFIDVLHTLVSSVVSPLIKALLLLGIATFLHPHIGLGIWPTEWPVALQLLLAIPVADFGIYVGHRLMHTTDIGWRIHAIHHSTQRLHFWASARSHPFNVVIKMIAESGVLLVLGVQPEVYALFLVFMTTNGLLQHSNIDLRPGLLSYVLATNEIHQIHHARPLHLSNSNFGNTTMIWDRIFGTFRLPPERVTEVGVEGYAIPERYGAHLLTPFLLQRFETSEQSPVNMSA